MRPAASRLLGAPTRGADLGDREGPRARRAEVAGSFEIAGDRSQGRQSDCRRLARERRKERRAQLVRIRGSGDGTIEQRGSDAPLSDRDECGLDRATTRYQRFSPLHKRDECLCRIRPALRRCTVDTKRRKDEAGIAGGHDDEGTDRANTPADAASAAPTRP